MGKKKLFRWLNSRTAKLTLNMDIITSNLKLTAMFHHAAQWQSFQNIFSTFARLQSLQFYPIWMVFIPQRCVWWLWKEYCISGVFQMERWNIVRGKTIMLSFPSLIYRYIFLNSAFSRRLNNRNGHHKASHCTVFFRASRCTNIRLLFLVMA